MIDQVLLLNSLPLLISGVKYTIIISFCSCFIGFVLGSFLALFSFYGGIFLKFFVEGYVVIVRGTPMLIQIFAAYYALPFLGIHISAITTAIIAIGLNSAAYVSQTIKSGINAVHILQIEAAYTLGFSKIQTMRYIILPQAIAVVFPSLSNELVTLIKDSSLASTIGVAELTKEGRVIISQTYDAISIFLVLAVIYLFLTSVVAFLMRIIENKYFRM
jgi:His/Glu/Gln/Arg/opine family amino acid ABC transporter permease subunit